MTEPTAAQLAEALTAASFVTGKSDELHVEAVEAVLWREFPMIGSWSRQYQGYDDMPGGDWYLVSVKNTKGEEMFGGYREEEAWVEIVNDLLGALYEWGEHYQINEHQLKLGVTP